MRNAKWKTANNWKIAFKLHMMVRVRREEKMETWRLERERKIIPTDALDCLSPQHRAQTDGRMRNCCEYEHAQCEQDEGNPARNSTMLVAAYRRFMRDSKHFFRKKNKAFPCTPKGEGQQQK